jgi:hypothetical protein
VSGRRYSTAKTARIGQRGAFSASDGSRPKALSKLRWPGAEAPDQHRSLNPCQDQDSDEVSS